MSSYLLQAGDRSRILLAGTDGALLTAPAAAVTIVTGHFGRPSPSGGRSVSSPGPGRTSGTPSGGSPIGSPAAARFGSPSPEVM